MKDKWPFADPKNVATFTTKQILEGTKEIKHVSHDDDDDGAWQFHSGDPINEEDGRIVSLEEIITIDTTILELADLPLGWVAIRDGKQHNWRRLKL
jgi:hypothetical protein